MTKKGWILIGAAVVAIVSLGSVVMFNTYKNRFGKRLVLLRSVLEKFLAMKKALASQGIDIEMTDAWRGEIDQNKALAGGYSKAKFGLSPHNFGAAFDAAPVIAGKLQWPDDTNLWNYIGEAGKDQGLVWGGDFKSFKDLPHFELPGWKNEGLALLNTAPEAPFYG